MHIRYHACVYLKSKAEPTAKGGNYDIEFNDKGWNETVWEGTR